MIFRCQERTIMLHASQIVIPTQSICNLPHTPSNLFPTDTIRLTIQVQFCALYTYNCVGIIKFELVNLVAHSDFVPDEYHNPY
ncbi:hypothetical protein BS47DRAFT_1350611 [Hydnum rufescens UP504]|uniref:Uncharacterized protein n=1 Tax=Hydnum rufescens UP504 TaxID=1448309 RepID=A0A9P6DR85_9AGAM|nr:hypothetical protein BS47DRAFT_1350611 [Hydnum rufescens UP504]